MSSQLGPLEIHCDSPAYSIVRACHLIGFHTPEDVRWYRMSHFLGSEEASGPGGGKFFAGLFGGRERTCSCRHKLPVLEKYTFTFLTGHEASYLLGQCPGCSTIFWEEA
jgi:hypothetical protein